MSVPFAPKPSGAIDWDNLGANVIDVNGHAECTFDAKTGEWSSPGFMADPYIRVHGLSPGVNYGQQAVEGMKAYRSPSGEILIFRPEKHSQRFQHSCTTVSIPPIPTSLFIATLNLAIARNGEFAPPHSSPALLYLRPVVFASGPQLMPTSAPKVDFTFVVFAFPMNGYAGTAPKPLDALVLEDFDRAAPRGAGHAKIGGNYAPVLQYTDRAKSEGFALSLHLDSETREKVEEFSISGVVAVESNNDTGTTVVVPDSPNVIESVTADSAMVVARELFGWKAEKSIIPFDKLGEYSEFMTAGTGSSLVGVKSITRRLEGGEVRFAFAGDEDGKMGPVTTKLADALREIQKGLVEDRFGWCYTVRDV